MKDTRLRQDNALHEKRNILLNPLHCIKTLDMI